LDAQKWSFAPHDLAPAPTTWSRGDDRPQPRPLRLLVSAAAPTVLRVTAPASRDAQRSRVYRAEDAWAARLDAARLGAPLATVGGSSVLLPAERRLGSLEAAAAYCARVVALAEVVAALGAAPPPRLRLRRGARSAHWEAPGTIALPVPAHGEPWALRETVLLHELAHHLGETAGRSRGHRAPFPAVVLLLVRAVLGEEAALALRVEYGEHDVEVGQL
jgi:putative metallohydrolase (TIGR04338 family)